MTPSKEMQTEALLQLICVSVERAVGEGFTFPLVLVGVGADGQVVAFKDAGEGPVLTPLCADVKGTAFVQPINILIVDSTGKGSHVVIDVDNPTGRWVH